MAMASGLGAGGGASACANAGVTKRDLKYCNRGEEGRQRNEHMQRDEIGASTGMETAKRKAVNPGPTTGTKVWIVTSLRTVPARGVAFVSRYNITVEVILP